MNDTDTELERLTKDAERYRSLINLAQTDERSAFDLFKAGCRYDEEGTPNNS